MNGEIHRSPLLLLATALLTSCSLLRVGTPQPEPGPAEDAPAEWTAPRAASLAAAAEAPDPWWASFGDPALTGLVEETLSASPDLRAAAARLDQAAARARVAGAALWPQADGSFSASRSRRNFIGFPIPGSGERVLSTISTNLGVSLNVSWEADLWGRIRAGRDAAESQAAAAEAELAGAALSLTGQTAKAWFAVREARAQAALARQTLASRELTTERVRRRYEAGLRPSLDLRLARSEEAAARAGLEARGRALDALERQLQVLAGRYPAGAPAGPAGGDELPGLPPPPPPIPPGVPSEIVTRRPDLAAAEARLAAAGHRVAEARAALYPRLSLTGSAGRSSEELEDLLDHDFSVWTLAGNVLQPVFQGGRLRANVDLARASFQEATALYAARVLQAFREVETGLAADAFLAGQEEALETATAEARAGEELARDRYRQGLQDFLTVLEAQRRRFDAESRLLQVRRTRLDARVDLILALGGGFDAGDSPTPAPADAEVGRFKLHRRPFLGNRQSRLKRPSSGSADR